MELWDIIEYTYQKSEKQRIAITYISQNEIKIHTTTNILLQHIKTEKYTFARINDPLNIYLIIDTHSGDREKAVIKEWLRGSSRTNGEYSMLAAWAEEVTAQGEGRNTTGSRADYSSSASGKKCVERPFITIELGQREREHRREHQ